MTRILAGIILLAAGELQAQTLQDLKAMPSDQCMESCIVLGIKQESCPGISECGAQCRVVCYETNGRDMAGFYVAEGVASDSLKNLLNPNGYCFQRYHYMTVTTSGSAGQKIKDVVSAGLKVAAVAADSRTARVGALAGSMVADSFTLTPGSARVNTISDRSGNYEGIHAEFVNDIALIEFFESNGWHYVTSSTARDGSQRFVFAQPAPNDCGEEVERPVAEN